MAGEYKFKYYGSSGVQPLEFTGYNMNDEYAKENVLRSLVHYWPTYYSAAVWREDGTLVAEFKSEISVREVSR